MSSPDRQSGRYLCSHLVRLIADGREQWANLEEIWETGAVLDCEAEVAPNAAASFRADDVSFTGRIAKVDKDRFGWRVELELSSETPWSIERWKPEHSLDPGTLPT
jgi:hypothetical protein